MLSETIADCETVAKQEDLRQTPFWDFDYSGMNDSPAAKSGVNVTFNPCGRSRAHCPRKSNP